MSNTHLARGSPSPLHQHTQLVEKVTLLGTRQCAQAIKQQSIKRLGARAERVGKGQVSHPSVATLCRPTLTI
ncbi:hypothetical protein EMIT0P2_100065 [Pseudomonas sp. IT-P2]